MFAGTSDEKPIICAHNARSFDMRVITREMKRCGLQEEFAETVTGFMDSLPAFKSFLPALQCGYSQVTLYQRFVGHSLKHIMQPRM